MDTNYRLHLATRIHFILLRELGRGIDVSLMLKRELYALDVINVCRASDNDELARLAEQFIKATRSPEFAWARTTGFGESLSPSELRADSDFGVQPSLREVKAKSTSWWSPLAFLTGHKPAPR
jgi:hypothetical protein